MLTWTKYIYNYENYKTTKQTLTNTLPLLLSNISASDTFYN